MNKAKVLSDTDWYLLSSKPKQESRAVENLKNQSIEAFCPKLKVEKLVRGKRKVVVEPLFTGYLFVQISPSDPQWYKVRSTRGVRDWVRFGQEPAKLPKALIDTLVEFSDENNLDVQEDLKKGAEVRIESGPFQGLKGIFDAPDGEMRSLILIEILGNRSLISIENEQFSTD